MLVMNIKISTGLARKKISIAPVMQKRRNAHSLTDGVYHYNPCDRVQKRRCFILHRKRLNDKIETTANVSTDGFYYWDYC